MEISHVVTSKYMERLDEMRRSWQSYRDETIFKILQDTGSNPEPEEIKKLYLEWKTDWKKRHKEEDRCLYEIRPT